MPVVALTGRVFSHHGRLSNLSDGAYQMLLANLLGAGHGGTRCFLLILVYAEL
jgi:hypothetical protein